MAHSQTTSRLKQHVVALTNPTSAPQTLAHILSLLHPDASYQVIPTISKYYLDSVWLTLKELLPRSM